MSHDRVQDRFLVSEILPVLDELAALPSDDCLQRLTEVLQRDLNCETASILLWNEVEGKLITRYSTGMPAGLGPERYDPNEGLTGKYIFSGKCVRYLINTEALQITNEETGEVIIDPTINWKYIQAFKQHSLFKDFRSLLGVPFFVKNQKIGVVKLINKKDNASGTLAHGFSEDDERILLGHYLKTIQYVVNAKRNEEQSKALLKISERNTSAVFEFKQVLTDAAKTCAESLNYRVCVIRLLEDGRLSIKATSTDTKLDDNYVDRCDPSFLAFAEGTALVWNKNGLSNSNTLELTTFDGSRKYSLPSPSERVRHIIRDHGLNSFLIAPIRLRKEPIGTIECFTSLPHEFSGQELDTINTYGSFIATSLQKAILVEEKTYADSILEKLIRIEDPHQLLSSLLAESIALVGGDSGDITLLTHIDEKLRLPDPPITFGIERDKRTEMIHPLSVGTKSSEGIVGYAARTKKFYWSGDVENDDKYLREFKEVKSELAVPLLYSEKVIGVLNINSNHKDRFDDRKGNLIQSVADRATILYQKARVAALLKVTPFNVFSKVSDLYATIIKLIERFLKTDAVSIWEKTDIEGKDFQLNLVHASQKLGKKYAKNGIEYLDSATFTARAVKNREVVAVGEREIASADFAFSEFAVENGFKHMTSVPIRVGQEVYAVIDVFSRRPVELFPEEIAFLELIASKAAMAIQGAKLIRSFNDISESLLVRGDDIETSLQKITDSALELLHADPVILYRYEADHGKFILPPVASGTFLGGDIREVGLKKNPELRENDIANVIRKHGTMYFKDVQAFSRFTKKIGRKYRPHHFKRQFWYRENISSLAALRLEHAGTVVGVMFVNFRSEQDFTQSAPLIEAYAGQAALAIVNAKLMDQTETASEFRRSVAMAFSASQALVNSAHSSNQLLHKILLDYLEFTDDVKRSTDLVDKDLCLTLIKNLRGPLKKLSKNLQYQNLNEFKPERCKVDTLIDNSLSLLRKRFELAGVKVIKSGKPLPTICCDKNQIQDVFVNLLLNSYEAMTGSREKLIGINTSIDANRRNVRIEFSDTGRGVSSNHRSRIFERGFSTKARKTNRGLGLSISRFIIQSHGGQIELSGNKRAKGATFSVLLPLQRQGDK